VSSVNKKYEEYKKSGTSWIGDIPSTWQKYRLKNTLRKRITDGPHLTPEFIDEGVPFLSVDGIQEGELVFEGSRFISKEDYSEFSKKAKPELGDILMGKAASTGKIARVKVDCDFSIWSPLALIKIDNKRFSSSYIEYCLKSPEAQYEIDRLCTSNTQKNISMDDIPSIFVCAPNLEGQKKIVSFLDCETAKVNELIQKQEKLIDLIEEKITSVTDKFITKGLDNSAVLKKTKFQALGEIPNHWDVLKIKKIVSIPVTDGPHETPEFIDDGVPFLSAEGVSKGFIDFEKIRGYISHEANEIYSKKYSPRLHDIYMVKSGATTGVTAIVENKTDFNIWSPLAVIRCSSRMNPYYVLYAMRSKYFQEMVSLSWSFGTQQNIGMGVIENLYLPIPPKHEQDAIVLKINSVLKKLTQLKEQSVRGINLLKEHRVSLISAAVTGKIDVRELA